MKAISLFIFLALSSCASEKPDHSPMGKLSRQFQQCYHESDSIYTKPPTEGKMVLKLKTNPDGKVNSVKITESDFSKDRNFEACISGLLRNFQFDSASSGNIEEHTQNLKFTAKQ